MVKTFGVFLSLLLLFFSHASGADISVASETEGGTFYENQPIKVLITVTHPEDQTVDTNSFRLGDDPIDVEFSRDVRFGQNNNLLLSFYSFQIPGKVKGLYALPGVSVKIGGVAYRSIVSSYTVKVGEVPESSPTQNAPASPSSPVAPTGVAPSLKIEAYIDGKDTVYPGERFKAVYKYIYTGEIDLIKEALPLLDGEGFVKIGEKEIVDDTEGSASIRLISQVFEAKKTGSYSFGPSIVEGNAYVESNTGKKVYVGDRLVSKAPTVTIKVLPFPEQDKPASFTGAIGEFTFSTSLQSSPDMNVGDEFVLNLIVGGKGNFNTVAFSNLCCQPGFSGFFKVSDLPPLEETKGDVKTVQVKMRAMTDTVKSIPALEFSFFSPSANHYTVLRSDPIPINVAPAKLPPLPDAVPNKENGEEVATRLKEPDPKTSPEPIGIEGILPLAKSDLMNLPFGNWWVLALLPLFALLLLYQWCMENYLKWLSLQPHIADSKMLFDEAFAGKKATGYWDSEKLKNAYKQALFEAGLLPSPSVDDDLIQSDGISGEIKALLAELDRRRFSGGEAISAKDAYQKAKPLFERLQKETRDRSQGDVK